VTPYIARIAERTRRELILMPTSAEVMPTFLKKVTIAASSCAGVRGRVKLGKEELWSWRMELRALRGRARARAHLDLRRHRRLADDVHVPLVVLALAAALHRLPPPALRHL
jgi:hypothetical protein